MISGVPRVGELYSGSVRDVVKETHVKESFNANVLLGGGCSAL